MFDMVDYTYDFQDGRRVEFDSDTNQWVWLVDSTRMKTFLRYDEIYEKCDGWYVLAPFRVPPEWYREFNIALIALLKLNPPTVSP